MDLRLFSRVVWRFRLLVGLGFLLALALAVLSLARVSFADGPHLTYRKPTIWSSVTTLLVTQRTGGPEFRHHDPAERGGRADPRRRRTLHRACRRLRPACQQRQDPEHGSARDRHPPRKLVAIPQVAPDGTNTALPAFGLRASHLHPQAQSISPGVARKPYKITSLGNRPVQPSQATSVLASSPNRTTACDSGSRTQEDASNCRFSREQ